MHPSVLYSAKGKAGKSISITNEFITKKVKMHYAMADDQAVHTTILKSECLLKFPETLCNHQNIQMLIKNYSNCIIMTKLTCAVLWVIQHLVSSLF